MTGRWLFHCLLPLGLLLGCSKMPSESNDPDSSNIERDVRFLAHDARSGREPGTAGYNEAASYVADRFAEIGLRPVTGNDWFQQVPLRSSKLVHETVALSITHGEPDGDRKQQLAPATDFVLSHWFVGSSPDVSARSVFIGYGVDAPSIGHDDYATMDVEGAVVVAFAGAPKRLSGDVRSYHQSYETKLALAAEHGAIGFIEVPSESGSARRPWPRIVSDSHRNWMTWVHPNGQAELPAQELEGFAYLSNEGATKLFAEEERKFASLYEAERRSLPLEPFLMNVTIEIRGQFESTYLSSANVMGVVPGTDPALHDEFVVITAHLDHLGERLSSEDQEGRQERDIIYNGAMDNAMGVSIMLDVASLLQSNPARRSAMFVALTAEETGLSGADYFTHNSPVPKERLVANVNLDMSLVLFPFVDIIALGADRSTLQASAESAARSADLEVMANPLTDQGLFTRADHYRFVEIGVPSTALLVGFGGGGDKVFAEFLGHHYHSPSDDMSLPIDYRAAKTFSEFSYRLVSEIGNDPVKPDWITGDFFGERFGSPRRTSNSPSQ